MHSKIWYFLIVLNKLGFHGRGDDVSHMGHLFRQVGGEVHLFPTILFLLSDSRKSKVWTHSCSFYEIYHAIYLRPKFTHRILIYWGRMGFKVKFNKTIFSTVCVNIFQNKGILVTFEPSILPIESNRLSCWDGFLLLVALILPFRLISPDFHLSFD